MAIYKITSLNYMTAGTNRAFVNIDTVLGYELYRPVYLLRNEQPYVGRQAVSAYADVEKVAEDWADLSAWLSSFGGLADIRSRWSVLSGQVQDAILDGDVQTMKSTPLSALSSDIVTEQRDGGWLKTEYLAKEYFTGTADENAMASLSSSENVLLTEQQRYYSELSDGHRRYIRLCPPGTDRASVQKIDEFNRRRRHVNRTFIMDTNLAFRSGPDSADGIDSGLNDVRLSSGEVLYPMYDMVDVHVKGADECGPSMLKSFDAKKTRRREDIYLPQLKKDPIGHCQVQGDAYMLTEATAEEPGVLESSLTRQRLDGTAGRTYTVQIRSGEVKTYLYARDPDTGIVNVESLPKSNIAGIEYNNITQFPQSRIEVGYSQGNEYGYMVRGKNSVDSRYNMTLSADGSSLSVYGCRDYAGIGQFGGDQLYVKFYDGASYRGVSSDAAVQVRRSDNSLAPVVPYQKIECAYMNRYASANMHKTRFFSVKMLNTELGQYENLPESSLDAETGTPNPFGPEHAKKRLYGQIMQDIRGAVREIVENLQPSHTQLYKIMFDG